LLEHERKPAVLESDLSLEVATLGDELAQDSISPSACACVVVLFGHVVEMAGEASAGVRAEREGLGCEVIELVKRECGGTHLVLLDRKSLPIPPRWEAAPQRKFLCTALAQHLLKSLSSMIRGRDLGASNPPPNLCACAPAPPRPEIEHAKRAAVGSAAQHLGVEIEELGERGDSFGFLVGIYGRLRLHGEIDTRCRHGADAICVMCRPGR